MLNSAFRSAACCVFTVSMLCLTLVESISAQQPIIGADILYHDHTLVLGKNIKHLVILIPNEAHHGPNEEKEKRFIEQPFLPGRAIVNVGTTVVWFSGDVGHTHKIIINRKTLEGLTSISVTKSFKNHEGSESVQFDSLGHFEYSEVKEYRNGFVMRGHITVTKHTDSMNTATPIDTVGVLMVPTGDALEYAKALKHNRFIVHSAHNFRNLNGKQKEVGNEQTLLVWGTYAMDISQVIAELREISLRLPYS